ncbi:unnamed protein product, partial [Ceratitis capitata]
MKRPKINEHFFYFQLDCKNCKYDALIGETTLSNSYDYSNNSNMTGGGTDSGDDSCRLLYNSPAKLNQNQMLTATKINTQYYQQQQQQQPDVMLMATTATAMAAQKPMQQQQQQYQQLYNRSATPSPQHFQQQQQQQHPMQTFHIVSANSSPTQHSGQQQQQPQQHATLRQYATLQHKPHIQQQQYVAVPSGALLRFHTTTPAKATTTATATATATGVPQSVALSGNSNNCTTDGNGNVGIGLGATLITTGVPSNCYQSANVSMAGGTATATIYFPIATAAHPQPANYAAIASAATVATGTITPANSEATALVGGVGAGSGSGAAAATQLLCNQPIVKYHTIQLTHARKQPQQQQQQQQLQQPQTTLLDSGADVMPLPPPPAYQTATVHVPLHWPIFGVELNSTPQTTNESQLWKVCCLPAATHQQSPAIEQKLILLKQIKIAALNWLNERRRNLKDSETCS